MSNKKLFLIFFAILVGFLISMTFSLVYADMQVELKDGRTVGVPVNKAKDTNHQSMQPWRMA